MKLMRRLRARLRPPQDAGVVEEWRAFDPVAPGSRPSAEALRAAASARGVGRGPALMLHGIMPRSGTVFVGEVLRLHPALHAYPNDLWELPFLASTGSLLRLREDFIHRYAANAARVSAYDLLPAQGASLLAYLHAFAPEGRRLLLKAPTVDYLHYFDHVFPGEHLLVLVRDGRDVVYSTLATWPEQDFADACRRWNRAARLILFCDKLYDRRPGYWLARYEHIVQDPRAFARGACEHFGLDVGQYPFDQIDRIPVRGSSTDRPEAGVSWKPLEKPKGFAPVGRWQSWSPAQRDTFKRLAGDALVALGYAPDQRW